jgi:NADPH-dependent glutamate synthase beta subunit-like oxidoreductase
VFAAIGQSPDLTLLDEDGLGEKLERTRWNSIVADEGTMYTKVNQVFAGGDGWRGAATAVEAIRDGRFAARSIHQLLGGEDPEVPGNWYLKAPKLPGVEDGFEVPPEPSERVKMPDLHLEERRLNFKEVELGLAEEMARKEAERCFQCGVVCYRGHREKAS